MAETTQSFIILVDDDPQVLKALERDIRTRYRKEYRVLAFSQSIEVLPNLKTLRLQNQPVALIISDQRMPELEGVDLLAQVRTLYPDAKRVLITAYADIHAAIKAINDVQLDYYLVKPWDPPTERLYPIIDEMLTQWQEQWLPPLSNLRVIGYQWSPRSHEIKDFLAGNLVPFTWIDSQNHPKANEWMQLTELSTADLPAVVLESGAVLKQPSRPELANALGMSSAANELLYDVAIIGSGPAGLAAGVYGASEGLKTLVIERQAPGGQAGTSSRIENYLGFPTGLSGSELTQRALTQAKRLGAEFITPVRVLSLEVVDGYKQLKLDNGQTVHTKSLIIASGVEYRHLETPGLSQFTGAGVYYGAATTEATACKAQDVFIVGGGNSAGQGAMFLSAYARKVYILIRRESLASTMSQYLIDQIAATPNIEVLSYSEIVAVAGTDRLTGITIQNVKDLSKTNYETSSVFIFIGTKPGTDWLPGHVLKDDKGYILSGRDVVNCPNYRAIWKLEREPFLLECSIPGVFVAGDVRHGAMNRIASAVGEGAMCVKFVHEYLG
jgi:thioredoxin reductase (NADPH)